LSSFFTFEFLDISKNSILSTITLNLTLFGSFTEFMFDFNFIIDEQTAIMLFVVSCISCCVHLYSLNYIDKKEQLIRFLSFLSLFTLAMLILITAENFIQLFIG